MAAAVFSHILSTFTRGPRPRPRRPRSYRSEPLPRVRWYS